MSESSRISTLMMERYNLREITGEEKKAVEAALVQDPRLTEQLADIRRSDMEIRNRYPPERFLARRTQRGRRRSLAFFLTGSIGAAALLLLIALPFFRTLFPTGMLTDRIKGGGNTSPAELSVFLKSDMTYVSNAFPLADQTVLREGNTVQLAYTVNSSSYGVIFSIDGRSAVTMHYPYELSQSTRLTPGKWVALDEAYTLDDAPDYEIFFFVISDGPLDVSDVLKSAVQLARNPGTALERCGTVFRSYEVKTVTLRKE
jgi:hypothetical protein